MHLSTHLFAKFAFAALCTASQAQALTMSRRATTCNGHPELCDRSYGAVTFVGAHNSYAVGINNIATNQDYDVKQQLKDGVRLLQLQVHLKDTVPQLCHTNCFLLDAGPLQTYLGTVKTWMDANPEDVVSIIIVNSDNVTPAVYAPIFIAAGLDTLAYSPEAPAIPAASWPTLGALIDTGKRLVVFLDNSADYASVPWLVDEFSNVWETKFNALDTTFACQVDRTQGEATTQMFLINHYLDKVVFGQAAPDRDRANTTNAVSGVGSLGLEVETCNTLHGKNPNFLLVNFYEYGGGSVFQVAATANGVTYAPTSAIAVPIPETTGSSTSPSSGDGSGTTVTTLPISAASVQWAKSGLVGALGLITGAMLTMV